MGLCSLVTRRNGTYIFRKRVPDELQNILGKKTIKKSLRTSNPDDAKKQKAKVEAEVMELFAKAKAELAGTPYTPTSSISKTAANIAQLHSQANATAKGTDLTIQDIFDKWADSKKRSTKNKGSAQVSIERNQQKLQVFIGAQGNIFIGSINPAHPHVSSHTPHPKLFKPKLNGTVSFTKILDRKWYHVVVHMIGITW